jgi:hypothetical protein
MCIDVFNNGTNDRSTMATVDLRTPLEQLRSFSLYTVTDSLQLAGATSDNAEKTDIRPAALRSFLVIGTHCM